MSETAPEYPAGPLTPTERPTAEERDTLITDLATLPAQMRQATDGLTEAQLETVYRNWTVRQIVHHLADSHAHCFLRYKLSLTEDDPTIKPYDETATAELADSRLPPIGVSLQLLDAVHARWDVLLRSMSDADFDRRFFHPEQNAWVSLGGALSYYPWHGRHHAAQIGWLREHRHSRPA